MARRLIPELLELPAEEHDLDWLHEALQWAVDLEFATIPVYLSGLWSIKPPPDNPDRSVYNLIQSVVTEEMLHMALACNLVTAIGGDPPEINPPRFPGPLPGHVRPDLRVSLQGLSPAAVKMYMQIEQPEKTFESDAAARADETWPTIGAFYDEIQATFDRLQPQIQRDSVQLTTTLGLPDPNDPEGKQSGSPGQPRRVTEYLTAITWPHEVKDAIELIKDQGEGTGTSPTAPQYDNGELSHFYRFKEILKGKQYINIGGKWDFQGDPIPFPDCFPIRNFRQAAIQEWRSSKRSMRNTRNSSSISVLRGPNLPMSPAPPPISTTRSGSC